MKETIKLVINPVIIFMIVIFLSVGVAVAFAGNGRSHEDVEGHECEKGKHIGNPHCQPTITPTPYICQNTGSPTPQNTPTIEITYAPTSTPSATPTMTIQPTEISMPTPTESKKEEKKEDNHNRSVTPHNAPQGAPNAGRGS